MDDIKMDRDAMGRLAKAVAFICGGEHPAAIALRMAADGGTDQDVARARKMFLALKSSDRRAALAMLAD